MIPGVRTLINIPAGLADMSFILFLVTTFVGAYIWCAFLIGAGYLLGNQWMRISAYIEQYFPYILAGGSVLISFYIFFKNRKRVIVLSRDGQEKSNIKEI